MARPREASKGAGTLVLVNTTSFTSQSSINISINKYKQNHQIIFREIQGSTGLKKRMEAWNNFKRKNSSIF